MMLGSFTGMSPKKSKFCQVCCVIFNPLPCFELFVLLDTNGIYSDVFHMFIFAVLLFVLVPIILMILCAIKLVQLKPLITYRNSSKHFSCRTRS